MITAVHSESTFLNLKYGIRKNRQGVTLGADVILRERQLNNQLSAQRGAVVSRRIEIQSSELIRWL